MSSGTPPRPPAALMALATAAAVVAVVMVLVSGAVAGQRFATREPGQPATDGTTPTPGVPSISYNSVTASPTTFLGGQPVYGDGIDNAYYEAPPAKDGWKAADPHDWVEIALPKNFSGPKARAIGYVAYDQGYCAHSKYGFSSRAYVGFGVPAEATDDVKAANLLLVKSWRAAIVHDDPTGPAPVVHAARQVKLPDGTAAYESTITTRGDGDPCEPPRAATQILSLDTGDNVASIVVVHDQGEAGDISDALANKILTSVRVLR